MNHFEWDEAKREANLKKHGIDFVDAVKVFMDADRIEMQSTRNGEKRYQAIGLLRIQQYFSFTPSEVKKSALFLLVEQVRKSVKYTIV